MICAGGNADSNPATHLLKCRIFSLQSPYKWKHLQSIKEPRITPPRYRANLDNPRGKVPRLIGHGTGKIWQTVNLQSVCPGYSCQMLVVAAAGLLYDSNGRVSDYLSLESSEFFHVDIVC